MKKKATTQSAFFNPRALLGFALCLLGVTFALVALSGLTSRSVSAQAAGQKRGVSAPPEEFDRTAPQDLRGVVAVLTPPLREQKVIQPSKAPGHDHPEPMTPPLPADSGVPDAALQTAAGSIKSAPNPTGVSFDGVGVGLSGFAPGSNPPDVNGRVGATQYVQWNNTSFAIFNKTTGALLYGPAAGNTLFQALGGVCATHNDGDPVVTYDILSGRWILSQFVVSAGAGTNSHQCVAVSRTQDATGQYYLYDFVTDPTNFIDYPHTATWPDGYYMSAHVFNAAGTSYLAGRIYAFERDKMILGQPARMVSANLTGSPYGFLPADLDSLTPPAVGEAEYVMGPATASTAISARVAVTWGATPTIAVTQATVPFTAFQNPPCSGTGSTRSCVAQPSPATTADYLDNISGHFMYRLAYRNNGTQAAPQESIMANITVSGSTANDAVRWFEFRNDGNSTTQPSVFQQSTFDPDANYRWLGSIAMDKDGNIALAYSKSSTTVKPSIFITGRLAGDPINTMGTEVSLMNGAGVQAPGSTAGWRWGDYSALTLDPVDQCTFYNTNEYLKTNGTFNWSTRISAVRFPSCADAPAWGTVTGTVTSAETGAPVPNVIVRLNNGYAATSNASGVYSILVPAGSYTADALDPDRNCATAAPAGVPVFVSSGSSAPQNFTITGSSKLESNGLTIDDSTGNANGIVNKAECVNLNIPVKNNGCATESAISANLTTTTPGVTVINSSATYPTLAIDQAGVNSVPFKISVDPSFVCGTNIALSLNLTYASGTKSIPLSVPTCGGGANQSFGPDTLDAGDLIQTDRTGRNGIPSTCAGKATPAGGFPGNHFYQTYTFTNSGGAPSCFTVNINAATGGPGDIESVAYLGTYNPAAITTNYLGDTGISGLGTTIGSASYSFTVPALSNFVVVVEGAGTTASSQFSGTVSGFYDQTAGPGVCPASPAAPVLTGAASRMGAFDAPLTMTAPAATEPRNGNGNYTVVLSFNGPVQSGTASVSSGTGSVGSVAFNGNNMIVSLTGVTDQQMLTLSASNVTGTNGGVLASAAVNIGFLIGDTNNDRSVNSADIAQTKSQIGAVSASNFREDVTNNGTIDSADVALVKSKSGNGLH
jgi:Dockerin type I domain